MSRRPRAKGRRVPIRVVKDPATHTLEINTLEKHVNYIQIRGSDVIYFTWKIGIIS